MGSRAVVTVKDEGLSKANKRVFKIVVQAAGEDFLLSDHLARRGHIPSASAFIKEGVETLISAYSGKGEKLVDERFASEISAPKIEATEAIESPQPAMKSTIMFPRQVGGK